MKKLVGIVLALLLCATPLLCHGSQQRRDSRRIQIAAVSLKIYRPDDGWEFAVIGSKGDFSVWYYLPPDKACGSDGVILGNNFTLAGKVFESRSGDQLDGAIAQTLKFDFKDPDPVLKGKAFLVIDPVEGERKVYQRTWDGKFREAMIQELNDSLMSLITTAEASEKAK